MLSGNPYSRHFAAQDLCSPTPLVLRGCPHLSARTSALPLSISARVDAPVLVGCRQMTFGWTPQLATPALIAPLRFADSSGLDRNTGIAPRPTQLAFTDPLSKAGTKSRGALSPRHRRLSAKSSARPVSRPGALSYGYQTACQAIMTPIAIPTTAPMAPMAMPSHIPMCTYSVTSWATWLVPRLRFGALPERTSSRCCC